MASEKAGQTLPIGKGYKLRSKEREYEIVAVLGSGSFGITYLAKAKVSVGNISTTMSFAIKEHFISASCYRGEDGATVLTVPTAKSDVADSRADFITEANRLKKLCLKSRNIVSVNETFEANGTAYYVMEYLDGGSPSRCPEKDAVSIVMQVAEALDEIHKEHVLHLDLKPDNIVLKTNERKETYPVLIDFGISKHFDSKGRPTSSLSAKGASPGYAPQEQYAGVNEFSPKYDIYALGAVLFYLCTGKNPPDAFKISPNQHELRRELTGKVSANVEKAILNAMKPSAMERTPDIQRFRDDLMGIDFVPVMNVEVTTLDFEKEKAELTVKVYSNIMWNVNSDADWCKVSKSGENIVVKVSRNKELGIRSCDIVAKGATYQLSQIIRVNQNGTGTIVLPAGPTWLEKNRKNVYKVSSVIAAGCLVVGLWLILKPDHQKESRMLTQAIESKDGIALAKYAEKDSARAFLPYARYLYEQGELYRCLKFANLAKASGEENSAGADELIAQLDSITDDNKKEVFDVVEETYTIDTTAANVERETNNDYVKEDDVATSPTVTSGSDDQNNPRAAITPESNDQKFARASNDFNLMLSLARDGYAKAYYPLAVMYYNRGDKVSSKIWVQKAIDANVNRQQAQTLLSKIDPPAPTPTNDELFAKAKNIDDLQALADKGYQKAYAPLADMYFSKRNFAEANKYARKALSANSGRQQAINVIEKLDVIGFYDNGENGGKPKY